MSRWPKEWLGFSYGGGREIYEATGLGRDKKGRKYLKAIRLVAYYALFPHPFYELDLDDGIPLCLHPVPLTHAAREFLEIAKAAQ